MMRFAVALPAWALLLLALAAIALAWHTYSAKAEALPPRRRAALAVLRALILLGLIACLLRPVRVSPPETADGVVPILVDVSRSMAIADAGGRPRIEAAEALVSGTILPSLQRRFVSEVWTFGDALERRTIPLTETAATGLRSDLSGALRQVRERYRAHRIAGIVILSDGGDTGSEAPGALDDGAVPVFTIGVGSSRPGRDLEVLDIAAGEPLLPESAVDVAVSAVSRGSAAPFDLRLLENGRPVDVRRVTPEEDQSPVRVVFTVSPAADTATLYTAEIPSSSEEAVVENNSRSVVVEPPGRARRLLMVEGAPGFEHSFLKRALAADPGLEVDSVVRKGSDTAGNPTYFVQAAADRAPLLSSGFPGERAALYAYDAVLLANVEPDALTRAQLDALSAFVDERGGGLLVLGARSFVAAGLSGTSVGEALPTTLSGRDDLIVRAAARDDELRVSVTDAGSVHPVTRISGAADENARRWAALPALAGVSAVGAARPGAQVLATIRTTGGVRPLVVVQRYGRGRSMVFAGEASWRWRMNMPSEDRTYERFWRQSVRWLASGAPRPVTVAALPPLLPGDETPVRVQVRGAGFEPIADADVRLRVAAPGGETTELRAGSVDPVAGGYAAGMRFDRPGLYRITAESRRGSQVTLGERWLLVGGADREMSDPRLNEDVLRRLSRTSGGAYLAAAEAPTLAARLVATQSGTAAMRVEDVWNRPWVFAALIALLAAEWCLRRRFGLA